MGPHGVGVGMVHVGPYGYGVGMGPHGVVVGMGLAWG
jgi:hypothetical protein